MKQSKEAIESIRADVRMFARLGTEARAEIRRTTGDDRWSAWREKRNHGTGARLALLLLAWARGRSYASAESNVPLAHHEGEQAWATYHLAQRAVARGMLQGEPREVFAAWLQTPPTEAEASKVAEARARGDAARVARRESAPLRRAA